MVGGIKRKVKQVSEGDRRCQLALERMASLCAEEEREATSRARNESKSKSERGAEAGPPGSRSGRQRRVSPVAEQGEDGAVSSKVGEKSQRVVAGCSRRGSDSEEIWTVPRSGGRGRAGPSCGEKVIEL